MNNIYVMYLRKSRQDDPQETVEEVLSKHEAMLQEYARRELGGEIPEDCIYREVVSGENLSDREEAQKMLSRVESPSIAGILCVEPQRLSRGDLVDCGTLISHLRYTSTMVVTPMMTYDLTNKMERKFFQDELLRGRDYLEYTKEILLRGRIAAVKRGCYIGRIPPYGYDKITIGKNHSLVPNENADVVRLIFDLYVREGLTWFRIAQRLDEMGIPGPTGGKWHKDTVRVIIRNEHYIGKVVFNKVKATTVIENGEQKVKRLSQSGDVVIIAEGLHEAIIDQETWEAAQALVARNPRKKHEHALKNPLSSMIKCSCCGKAMFIHSYKHAEDRFECRTKPRCYKSIKVSEMYDLVLAALEHAELPQLKAKVKNDDGNARKIQERLVAQLETQLAELHGQEDRQYELLETGVYSQDVFERRNGVLREKIDLAQQQLHKARAEMPKAVDYAERVVALEQAIKALKDPTATPEAVNRVLKVIIDRIEYTGLVSTHKDKKANIHGYNEAVLEVFLRL